MLDLTPIEALGNMPDNKAGLWVDNAGITDLSISSGAEKFLKYRMKNSSWDGIYFGGVAFKSQQPVRDEAEAARLVVPFVGVVTTSGLKTGSAPELEKVKK